MSCLVNPNGWRLYHRKYWKTNFFLKEDNNYALAFFKTKNLDTIINNILNKLHLTMFPTRKIFLSFVGCRTFLFNKKIMILIKFNFLWNVLSRDIPILQNKFANPPDLTDYSPLKRKLKEKFFSKKKKLKILKKRNKLKNLTLWKKIIKNDLFFLRRGKIFPNYGKLVLKKSISVLWKRLFLHLHLFPFFIFLKKKILAIVKRQLNFKTNKVEIFFAGISKNKFNPRDIIKHILFLLQNRRFTSMKTLYVILRIMLNLQRGFNLKGFKFLLAGRFTRRDRATYIWKTSGAVSLNNKLANIEYYSFPVQLRYSNCVAKLWINY